MFAVNVAGLKSTAAQHSGMFVYLYIPSVAEHALTNMWYVQLQQNYESEIITILFNEWDKHGEHLSRW